MRHVIFGAGAIGGTIAARLAHTGHDVAVIARGDHGAAIADGGLTLRSPDDVINVRVPVASTPAEIEWRADDVVYLAMKSQDTVPTVKALVAAAPPAITIVCAQNGVQNERMVLRRFAHVQAMCVMCPAAHLEPGEILVYCTPVPAILEIGRYPTGIDATTEAIAADLVSAGFLSRPLADIMRWKYRKLLLNLGNAAQALCGGTTDDPDVGALASAARHEARLVYAAANIDAISGDEDAARPRRPPRGPTDRGPALRRLVDVAEPAAGHRVGRGRLPQRRDRVAGSPSRRAHPDQRGTSAAHQRGGTTR